MTHPARPLYVPALRMKTGELQGLHQLAEDIKPPVLPHLIVPPGPERDEELQGVLMDTESVPGAGIVLARYWAGHTALLDPQYLFDDFGEARCGLWLPKSFELARSAGVSAVPVAALADLSGSRARAFKDAIDAAHPLRLALRITSGAFVEPSIGDHIKRALEAVGITPAECAVLTDFTDADFSQPQLVSGVIEDTMDRLDEVGRWHAAVFQGTSYPEVNPAEHGGDTLVQRNEWKAWSSAMRFGRDTADHLVFGDYAADCARMAFGKNGGRAIRHYRYTTPDDWFVARGAETGDDTSVMRDVCRRILASGHFAGRSFSSADDYIYRTAEEAGGPGNSTNWREINTTHHITRVVRDIGRVKGLVFAHRKVEPPRRQLEMFGRDRD